MEQTKLYLKPNLKFWFKQYADMPALLAIKLIAYTEYCKKQGLITDNEFIFDSEELNKLYNNKPDMFGNSPYVCFINSLKYYNYKPFYFTGVFNSNKYTIIRRVRATDKPSKSTIKKFTKTMLEKNIKQYAFDNAKFCKLVKGKII